MDPREDVRVDPPELQGDEKLGLFDHVLEPESEREELDHELPLEWELPLERELEVDRELVPLDPDREPLEKLWPPPGRAFATGAANTAMAKQADTTAGETRRCCEARGGIIA